MSRIDLFEWSTFYYRIYKSCDNHWVALGRPHDAVPPRPDPLVRYIELDDREKIHRLIELLEWAVVNEMPLKL